MTSNKYILNGFFLTVLVSKVYILQVCLHKSSKSGGMYDVIDTICNQYYIIDFRMQLLLILLLDNLLFQVILFFGCLIQAKTVYE